LHSLSYCAATLLYYELLLLISQDTQSVADAARRARDQKKTNAGETSQSHHRRRHQARLRPAGTEQPRHLSQCRSRHSLARVECIFNCNSRKRPAVWLFPLRQTLRIRRNQKEVTELKAQIKKRLDDLNLVLREQSRGE